MKKKTILELQSIRESENYITTSKSRKKINKIKHDQVNGDAHFYFECVHDFHFLSMQQKRDFALFHRSVKVRIQDSCSRSLKFTENKPGEGRGE